MKSTENRTSIAPNNKLSLRKMSIDSILTTKNQSTISFSRPNSIHTSPLILNKQPMKEGSNIMLPSISVLTGQLSNKSENTAFDSGSQMMQYRKVSPVSESKLRTTMERPRSFSASNRESQYFEVNGPSFDSTYFQPLLPPSAIPIRSSQGSVTDDRDPFTNKRKSSFTTSNNILSTPAALPPLVLPTPFLNSQSPLIFPSTFPDGNLVSNNSLVNLMTPRFSIPESCNNINKRELKIFDRAVEDASLKTSKKEQSEQIKLNYNIKKAMNKDTNKVHSFNKSYEQRLMKKEPDEVLSPLEVPPKSSNKVSKSYMKKDKERKKKQQLKVLADTREDNRQRLGSSCNLCQLKKCKCNAKIEVVLQDEKLFKLNEEMQSDTGSAKLHFILDLTSKSTIAKLKEWMLMKCVPVPKEFEECEILTGKDIVYYKHLNKILKITSCSHCKDYKVGCFFKYGYSKDDKRLCYKLNLKVKNTYLTEKKNFMKGNISELPSESCYLNKLTVADYYKLLGL